MTEIKLMTLLPPALGKCPMCSVDHDPDAPHNKQSLYYQFRFYQEHERFPTWDDAMAHCALEVQAAWREELAKRGEVVS
jgi:hypothetical protein